MIKAVMFDFGQTLVDSADAFRGAEKEAQERLFSRLVRVTESPSREVFLEHYRRIRKEFHQNSNFSRQAVWQSVYGYFNCKPEPDRFEKWENEYWERIGSETHPFPETIPVLEKLARRYRLALVSNTQGQKSAGNHRLALFPQLERFFQAIVIAGESGIPPKPHSAPFRLGMQSLNVLPHETVFVGDDWRIDICGAEDAGIRPVWLQHHSVKRNWPDVDTAVPVITRLDALSDLLKRF